MQNVLLTPMLPPFTSSEIRKNGRMEQSRDSNILHLSLIHENINITLKSIKEEQKQKLVKKERR